MLPSDPSQSLRVLIVDRHEVSRAAIRALLRTEGLEVVGDLASPGEALASGATRSPDVVLLDIGAGPQEALDAASALARLRGAPAVVLTSSVPPAIALGGFAFIAKGEICASKLRRAMRSEIHTTKESRVSLQAYHDSITVKTGKTQSS